MMMAMYSAAVCERQPPGGVAAAQFSSLWPTDITIAAVMMMMTMNMMMMAMVVMAGTMMLLMGVPVASFD